MEQAAPSDGAVGYEEMEQALRGVGSQRPDFDRRSAVNCAVYEQLPSGHRGHVPTSARCSLNGL